MPAPSHPELPPPQDYVPWTPPGAPPATRVRDALRPLTVILVGALAVASLVTWIATRNQEPVEMASGLGEERTVATLLVDSEPVGASVWVQGDSVGVTPAWVSDVTPGVVEVMIRSAWGSHDTTLALRAGQDGSILVWLDTERLAEEPEARTQEIEERPQSAEAPPGGTPQETPATPLTESSSSSARRSEPSPERSERPTGGLQITTVPEGATVWLAGERAGTTPLTLASIDVGQQVVEVRAPGYEPERLRINIVPDELAKRVIELRTRPGIVTFTAASGSRVFVDGDLKGTIQRDPLRTPLVAGRHEVRVFHPELGEEYRVIEVTAGAALRVAIDPPASWGEDESPARDAETPPRRRGW